jgi:predicted transport protein
MTSSSVTDRKTIKVTGGKTIPENARLAHRFCNNSRSRRENINIDSELSEKSDFIKANKVGELIPRLKTFSTQKITRDPRPKKTIEELFEGADQELFSLFTRLDEIIMGISSEIDRYTTSIEVLYKTSFNFVCLAAQKKNNRIRIYLRTIQDKINDPKQLTEKVPKEFGYGNITRVLYLDPKDLDKKYSIVDIMELIMQSYNTTQ